MLFILLNWLIPILFVIPFTRGHVLGLDTVTACEADIDQSGVVDVVDYSILTQFFFKTQPTNVRADINQSGFVDIQDYSILVQFFFLTCTQTAPTASPTATPVPGPTTGNETGTNYALIQAENYRTGGQNVAYFDKSTGNAVDNKSNIYRTDDVDIKAVNSTEYAVGHMQTGEWLEYDFTLQTSGIYNLQFRHAATSTNPRIKIEVDGNVFTTVNANNTQSYSTLQTKTVTGTQLSSGTHRMRITVEQEYLDIDWVRFDKNAIIATSTPSPAATATPLPSNSILINPSGSNEPSNYVNTTLNQQSAGKTFVFKAGMHRISEPLNVQDGDTLVGEYGAIISGARKFDVSTVKRDGSLYYFDNQTQAPILRPTANDRGCGLDSGTSGTGCSCKADYPRCNYNDELFIDDVLLKHVSSKTGVVSGTFYFDASADRVYFADNPTGKKVEMTVGRKMISNSSARTVTVRNLIVEKFAAPTQEAAIENYGDGSIIEFSEIRWNHGTGGGVATNGIFRNNYTHHNGQFGVGGKGGSTGAVFEKNEVASNNTAGHEEGWGAGGSKWAINENITIKENYSHNNQGSGFWTDIDNRFVTYDRNIIVDNTKIGIQHELSFEADIHDNFVANNGNGSNHAQIFIQNSSGRGWDSPINVYRNTVVTRTDSGNGITVQNNNRGDSNLYPKGACTANGDPDCWDWIAKYVDIYDNNIYHRATHDEAFASGLYAFDRSQYPDPYNFQSAAPFIKFRNNQYYLPSATTAKWSWGPYWTEKTYAQFKTFQTGETKAVDTDFSIPSTPVWNFPRGPQTSVVTQ